MTARDLDATHAAAVAAERHADLRTRFAVALASGSLSATFVCGDDLAEIIYSLADALAAEDARRREADGAK